MYRHILISVALDHEGLVAQKLELARRLLEPGGRITLLTVLESVPKFVVEIGDIKPDERLTQEVRARLDALAADASKEGAGQIATAMTTGKAGLEVARYAREHDAGLVIVGSRHPSAKDYFLGSTAARIARRAPCSVMIVRD